MRLDDIVRELDLTVHAGEAELEREVVGGYVGDLMSEVIARAPAGYVWVTIQAHSNMVAVAIMKELAAVILSAGKKPEPDALERARREGVPLLGSRLAAYEIVGRLCSLGIPGAGGNARGV